MTEPKKRRSRRANPTEEVIEVTEALASAMAKDDPACLDDDRFTITRLSPLRGEEKKALYLTCFGCPIYEACSDYATTTKPAAGYWAGKNYGTWERKA